MTLKSYIPEAMQELKNVTADGIVAATLHLASKMKAKVGRSANKGRGKKGVIYEASNPGEPPRKRRGTLQQGIGTQIDRAKLIGKAGVPQNVIYGFWLEVGTRYIKPRPWMVSTLNQEIDVIRQLAAGKYS